ncbi:cytochrome c [Rhizobium sp. L1K21]|uniref:c-type cytochrome n=1 Tax=Rhizobium sp. L1K21 TaxID=2954933 RepID=UPI002093D938|nr:c-type cytochrome [Rhizobium sp. L1K21]MCO6188352.1 cytochrome c [Rhizobium sp. L1K21]
MIRFAAALLIFICLAAALFLFMRGEPAHRQADAQVIALGHSTYATHCAACHGVNGEGQPGWQTESTPENPLAPPHDATGHTWEHADRAIFRYIKTGVLDDICTFPAVAGGKGMPQFNHTLTDAEIKATIAYIVSRWPEQVRTMHEAINREYNAQDNLLAEN